MDQEFRSALQEGDLVRVRQLVEVQGVDMTATDSDGFSAPHIASYAGHRNIVHYIIVNRNFDYTHMERIGPLNLASVAIDNIIAAGNRAEAADVIFMRGIAQKYVEDDTVKQGRDIAPIMMNLIIRAINYIERCKNEGGFIPNDPQRPEIDRKSEFQTEAVIWVSACAKSIRQNNVRRVQFNEEIDSIFNGLKSLGKYMDLVHGSRGIQYGLDSVDTADANIIRIALPEILEELFVLRDYLQVGNFAGIPNLDISTIPALSNYYSDISHIERILIYTKPVVDAQFALEGRIEKETALRCIEAVGEAMHQHLSNLAKGFFLGIDTKALVGIRNYLDHINGDKDRHSAPSDKSRAVRLEELLEDRNPVALAMLKRIVQYDIPYIHRQAELALKQYREATVILDVPDSYDEYAHMQIFHEAKMEEKETACHKESWKNIKALKSTLVCPVQHSVQDSGIRDFEMFLRIKRMMLQEPENVLGRLKAHMNNEKEMKKILFNRHHLNEEEKRGFNLLKEIFKIDENMHHLTEMMEQIRATRAFFNSIPRGETQYVFGSPAASLKMAACIKSIEFNLINFNEHAEELHRSRTLQNLYTARYGENLERALDEFVAKSRKYLAHVGNNAFHGQKVDLGTIIVQVIPLAEQIHDDIHALYQRLTTNVVFFLRQTPNWDNVAEFRPVLAESPLSRDESLPQLLGLARQYDASEGDKKLIAAVSGRQEYDTFQNFRQHLGDKSSIVLAGHMSTVNLNLALTGGGLMKLMEVRHSLKYLADNVPILQNVDPYLKDSEIGNFLYNNSNAIATGLHFMGGAVFTYGLFGFTNIKVFSAPLISSTIYGARQYAYDYKQSVLSSFKSSTESSYLEEGMKLAAHIVLDVAITSFMSIPFVIIVGNPYGLLSYAVTQGAITGAINYFASKPTNESPYSDKFSLLATGASASLFAYKIYKLPTSMDKVLATACATQAIAGVHLVSKKGFEIVSDITSNIYKSVPLSGEHGEETHDEL